MEFKEYFKTAIEKNASDLHLVAGSKPCIRVGGDLIYIEEKKINNEALSGELRNLVGDKIWSDFKNKKSIDFSNNFFGSRFRLNLHLQEGLIGMSARVIPDRIPTPKELGFNEVLYNLTHLQDGLVLITGPSGAGKSTTLASMINIINQERRAHIITIEDPIEYIFEDKQSIVEQMEIGKDTDSFANALKYALRQDPNVIMVGEMRDLETISLALTAAETGHLVFSTLHTSTAPETIARIIDSFPAHQQNQVLSQISSCLRAVISQQLLRGSNGGRVAAREILLNNNAVSNLIKRNQIEQIYSTIQTSKKEGMISMNKAIEDLFNQGLIDEDTAKNRKRDLGTKVMYY